jgi:hypothetical protein
MTPVQFSMKPGQKALSKAESWLKKLDRIYGFTSLHSNFKRILLAPV